MDMLFEILNVAARSIFWIIAAAVYLCPAMIIGFAFMVGGENIFLAVILAASWPVWFPLAALVNWLAETWTEQISKISRFMARRKKVHVQRMFHGRSSYWSGTVKELSETVFKDYLESGWKLNHCVNRHPGTGEALVNALNRCSELRSHPTCYMVEPWFNLVPKVPEDVKAQCRRCRRRSPDPDAGYLPNVLLPPLKPIEPPSLKDEHEESAGRQ